MFCRCFVGKEDKNWWEMKQNSKGTNYTNPYQFKEIEDLG